MRSIYSILVVLLFTINCFGQPGRITYLDGNLNEIDSTMIPAIAKSNGPPFKHTPPNTMYLGTVTIDSTTDVSRIVHLRDVKRLNLRYSLEHIPNELQLAELPNLKWLNINCSNLLDFSKFPVLDSVEYLHISDYKGDYLSLQDNFPNLKELEIESLNQTTTLNIGKINSLKIRNCKPLDFGKISNGNTIKKLSIERYVSPDYSKSLNLFSKLEELTIYNVDLLFLPKGALKNLKKITVLNSSVSPEIITRLYSIESLEEINLMGVDSKWEKNN